MKLNELKPSDVPICICTKGRSGSNVVNLKDGTTKINYQAQNIGRLYETYQDNPEVLSRVYLFIEPKEVDDYRETYPKISLNNIIVLGDNDKGLAYTRQTALEFLQSRNIHLAVMLDDDCNLIEYNFDEEDKKGLPKASLGDLVNVIDDVSSYLINTPESAEPDKIGMAGLEYVQFGWSSLPKLKREPTYQPPEYSNYSYGDCCVWWFPMKYKELGIKYDNYPLKCDRDLTAQVIASKLYCRRITRWQMDSPLNGKGKGGCQEWYQKENQERDEVLSLIEKWNGEPWEFMPKVFEPASERTKEEEAAIRNYRTKHGFRCQFVGKKTSYGRSSDLKFSWRRISAYANKGVKSMPSNVNEFDDTLGNWKVLSTVS